jgi:anion-transporting  ArsA/GET3 family ATPase
MSVLDAAQGVKQTPLASPRPARQTRQIMDLGQVLDTHRVIVCVGSGGVGKTTTSAALAVHAASAGRHVLCLTIDPAKRLAQSLGLSELQGSEQVVSPALFAEQGLVCRGSLSAMMLDMKHTFDDLVARHASSPQQRQRIFDNRLYQYVSTSLAGTQEYMAMEKLHEVRRDPRFDLIVLDTPPTSNALDFLEAPQKLVGAIDSPVMRWFVDAMQSNAGLGLVGRGAAFVLKALARFTGAEFLEQVGEFIRELNELFGGFRSRAKAVYDDLKGPDVAFVVVTSPAPSSVAEAIFFSRKLREYGITPRGLVVNRVHPPLDLQIDRAVAARELAGAGVEFLDRPDLLARMFTAAEDAREQSLRDQQGLERLRKSVGQDLPFVEVPAFDRDVHDLAALARLSNHLAPVA